MSGGKIIFSAIFIFVFTLLIGNSKPPEPMASAQNTASKRVQEPKNKKVDSEPSKPLIAQKSAETKPEPPPAPPPPPIVLTGCEAVKAAVVRHTDWDPKVMAAIAEAESTIDANKNGVLEPDEHCYEGATGDGHLTFQQNGRTYGYSVSSLQVRILPGREHCDTHDLNVNVDCAHAIWLNQGYNAWTMYTNGRYLNYL